MKRWRMDLPRLLALLLFAAQLPSTVLAAVRRSPGSELASKRTAGCSGRGCIRGTAAAAAAHDEGEAHGLLQASEAAARTNATDIMLPGKAITVASLNCNGLVFAPLGRCPAECPLFTEEPAKACWFRCVDETSCGSINPKETVGDLARGVCRPCRVRHCDQCDTSGTTDICLHCTGGYRLMQGGCVKELHPIWLVIYVVVGAVAVLIIVWYIHIICLPIDNPEGLEEGLRYRTSLKLHQPHMVEAGSVAAAEAQAARKLWPLSTNLHASKVAGPGFVLHFNFQFFSIAWACFTAASWVIFCYQTHPSTLSLGLTPAFNNVDLCAATSREGAIQKELMEDKVSFMCYIYVMTTVGCLVFACKQQHTFDVLDDAMTMQDYAAMITGLPTNIKGDEKIEAELKAVVEAACPEEVVGVSICWDYKQVEEEITNALEREGALLDPHTPPPPPPQESMIRKFFNQLDRIWGLIFGVEGLRDGPEPDKEKEQQEIDKLPQTITEMVTTDAAFVVFTSEWSRDNAVEVITENEGVEFRGTKLKVEKAYAEPDTVKWASFHVSTSTFLTRFAIGLLSIFLALLFWYVVFYLPYAASYSTDEGESDPGGLIVFTLVVVIGNQIMYQVSSQISERVGFRFGDQEKGMYIMLYTVACLLVYILDLRMELEVGLRNLIKQGAHTADGMHIGELTNLGDIVRSYPMQSRLGQRLFAYAFPSSFFVPYVGEAFGICVLPYHIKSLLVRTHPEVRGRDAERSMDFFAPMDMGRYGDILLNMVLVCLIFFFPSGLMLKLFLAYIISHMFIYAYDQWKVLRVVPSFTISGNTMEKFAMAGMALPCACLLACWCFKAGAPVAVASVAFCCHILLHWLICFGIFPLWWKYFPMHQHQYTKMTYEEAAKQYACTWFSANPVHCLRSKFVYEDQPPCTYFVQGKEHTIQKNPSIGVFYEDKAKTEVEDYNVPGRKILNQVSTTFSDSMMQLEGKTRSQGGGSAHSGRSSNLSARSG